MPQPCELVHKALLIQKISGPACESQLTVSKSHRSGVEVGGGGPRLRGHVAARTVIDLRRRLKRLGL